MVAIRFLAPFTALLLSALVTSSALAQDVNAAPGPFEALPLVLKVGRTIKVRDHAGRATRGKLVSISADHLVVARRQYPFPYFRPRDERTLAKDAVRSIEIVDSWWNGALIGALVGAGVLAASIEFQCSSSSACDNFGRRRRWEVGKYLFIPAGAFLGCQLDGLINRTIYEDRPGAPKITLVPWFERDAKGVLLHVRF
jgi:hypothetical protein